MTTVRIQTRRRPGFTLMEVLIALSLFALGFVAVAAIFPAGIALQRNAAEDSKALRFADNAEAIVGTYTLLETDLTTVPTDESVYSYDEIRTSSFATVFPLAQRGLPTALESTAQSIHLRDYYWVPVFRKLTAGTWQTYIFAALTTPRWPDS